MIIRSSTKLRNAKKPSRESGVLRIESFENRKTMLDLREKLFFAEQQRLTGEPTISLDEAHRRLKKKQMKSG